jgi:hypothetical protein
MPGNRSFTAPKNSGAKCRVAKFLIDLWTRLGKAKYLDVPMSHQDIADHLSLTIETVSRAITDLERSGLITRVSSQQLLLQNRFALGHMMNWGNASSAAGGTSGDEDPHEDQKHNCRRAEKG